MRIARRTSRRGRGVTGAAADADGERAMRREMCDAIGADAVLEEAAALRLYSHDASTLRGPVPAAVCLPRTTAEVVACVRVAARHGAPIVPRGAGTGLAGGAVPVDGSVVISTTRMDRVLDLDVEGRRAWVQPGVVNLDLDRLLEPHGLVFAPDPSSQQACTVGGNVANNSGGPHCLAAGVTSAHVLAVEVVLADGEVVVLGGDEPEPPGYDLRGAFVGSEGTMGVATAMLLRLSPLPETVATLLVTFDDLDAAAGTVSDTIAAGIVPSALEMMDGPLAAVVEDFCGAGYPRDAAAVLLVEIDGPPGRVGAESEAVARIAGHRGARAVRVAADDAERAALWKGRKSAFGAVARIAPDYHLNDTVVPRRALVEVLAKVRRIAAEHDLAVYNVFHAGDGNLHPLLLFDARVPGTLERVRAAGARIVEVSLAAGGVLSGEHGIGLEKRGFMADMFDEVDLEAQAALRCAFDPDGRSNPTKVLPGGSRCAEIGTGRRGAAPGAGLWV